MLGSSRVVIPEKDINSLCVCVYTGVSQKYENAFISF